MRPITPLRPGQRNISARQENAKAEELERISKLRVSYPLTMSNGPSGMCLGLSLQEDPGIRFKNVSGFEVPPYGVMQPNRYINKSFLNEPDPYYEIIRPMEDPNEVEYPILYLVNKSDKPVPNNEFGRGTWATDKPTPVAIFADGYNHHYGGLDPYRESFVLASAPSFLNGPSNNSIYGNFYNQGSRFRALGGGIDGTNNNWLAWELHPSYVYTRPDGSVGPLLYIMAYQVPESLTQSVDYSLVRGSDSLSNGGIWPIGASGSAWYTTDSRSSDVTYGTGLVPDTTKTGSLKTTALKCRRRGYYRFDITMSLRLTTTTTALQLSTTIKAGTTAVNAVTNPQTIPLHTHAFNAAIPNFFIQQNIGLKFYRGDSAAGMSARNTCWFESFSWAVSRNIHKTITFNQYMHEGEYAGFQLFMSMPSAGEGGGDAGMRLDLGTGAGGTYPEDSANRVSVTRLRDVIKVG